MSQATFHAGGPTKSPSQLKTDSPKASPGREAFGKSPKQNCETVRAQLRKTPGRGKRI